MGIVAYEDGGLVYPFPRVLIPGTCPAAMQYPVYTFLVCVHALYAVAHDSRTTWAFTLTTGWEECTAEEMAVATSSVVRRSLLSHSRHVFGYAAAYNLTPVVRFRESNTGRRASGGDACAAPR